MKNNLNSHILIGINCDNIFIKPEGYITANLCFTMRENLYRKISDLNPSFNIYIDMSKTEYMDSTFLGLLIGLEKKIFSNFKKHIYIINPSKAALKYLEHFTLTFFLRIKKSIDIPADLEFKEFDDDIKKSDLEKLKMIFFSHEDLCSLNEENKKRFESLQEFLKKQIQEKS